jgi:hypothetical protein
MGNHTSRADALRAFAGHEVPIGPILSLVSRRRIEIIFGLGILFRVAQYLADRPLWMDEASLWTNIEAKSLGGLFGPLLSTQLAPPGFLVVEWLASRILGYSRLALRLFPLVGGVASLFLVQAAARRCLRPGGVWIALGLLAVSDDLIYFASELKQYSTDVAVGLLCLLLGMTLSSRTLAPWRFVALGALGAFAPWFSHPSVFALAGVGTVLLISALVQKEWPRALLVSITGAVWVASLAGVYVVSLDQLGHRRDMWMFWHSAFPPMPPSSLWDATWVFRRFVYLFVNPLDFETPLGPRLSIVPAVALFFAGCTSMWKRGEKSSLGMLVAPGLFALLASCLHLYPFHGRLVLFLVPSLLLLIAEGTAWLGETVGKGTLWAIVLGMLFLVPTLGAFYHLVEPRIRGESNAFGDRRPATLDPSRFPF